MNEIPEMTDPMGRYWDQPRDIRNAVMTKRYVILEMAQINQMSCYDASYPSAVYPGKCWMRRENEITYLVWFGEETPDHRCPIYFREIIVALT